MSKNNKVEVIAMKNKLLFIFFIAIVLLSVGWSAFASEYRSEVAVGLRFGQSDVNSVTVSSEGGISVYDAVSGNLLYTADPWEEIKVEMGATGFAAFGKFDASGITKISLQPQNGSVISCDAKKYRGYIYIEKTASGELLVINYVGTEDYVSSVLGKEMSYTWPLEALKAQAVCARNFVLCRGNAHKNYGFDVCSTTHCQVYGGLDSEHENTRRAVEETKGVLAKYNGKVVSLYFFATSGGHTEDVENVWGSPYGYLKAVPDTYENPQKASRYTWNTTLSKSDIEEKLLNAGADIGSLKSITVDSVTSTGRVTALTFNGTKDSFSVKREKCRTILGLYSQKFSIVPDSVSNIATTNGVANAPYYACTKDGIGGISGYSVISANGKIENMNINSSGAQSYTINGGGYGHGVGMSQWGARGMAENGFTYDQILTHYFTDIVLE